MITHVHSGGQTGGDQGALFAGRALGRVTGGWAPKGWRTDAGPAPWLADYGLREAASADYTVRTRFNVMETDYTLIFGDVSSPGCRLTLRLCRELGKPHYVLPWRSGAVAPRAADADALGHHLHVVDARILNGAGNREKSQPGIARMLYDFLTGACGYPSPLVPR